MLYHVIFQLDGEERAASVDAPDAATAVSQTQVEFGRGDEMFELISVTVDGPLSDEELSED